MAQRKNYPEEFKRDAVDLVRSSKDRTLTDIARSLGIHLETLRNWVRDDKARARSADGRGDAGMTPDEKDDLRRRLPRAGCTWRPSSICAHAK